MSFKSRAVTDALLKAISKKDMKRLRQFNKKQFPILERKDVLASAQTGSGKTAGFALPMLQILNNQPPLRQRPVRALIPQPENLQHRCRMSLRIQRIYRPSLLLLLRWRGRNPKLKLRNGVDILVATPGRLLDLEQQMHLPFKS